MRSLPHCRSWPKRSALFSPVSKSIDPLLADGLTDLSRQLVWHDVGAEVEFMSSAARPAGEVLTATARSHPADLLVMGGYGHSRMREIVFGGFTESVSNRLRSRFF